MGTEEILYEIEGVPDTFYEEARENVVLAGDVHVMDEKPAERLAYAREFAGDINEALDRYNADTVVFNGDTGSPDHIGTILEELEASQAIFIEGDEDRKKDKEINYNGWANLLEKEGAEHFDTDVDYRLEDEHMRLDEAIDLPGHYPVHVQHFPEDCQDSEHDLGFQATWFANPLAYELDAYDISSSMNEMPQVGIHSHNHGYDAQQIGKTALISLPGGRSNYVTNGNLPENGLAAISFGKNDLEVVHQARETGVIQESQRFRETKKGFKMVDSKGKAHFTPLDRYEKGELPPKYLQHLLESPNRKRINH